MDREDRVVYHAVRAGLHVETDELRLMAAQSRPPYRNPRYVLRGYAEITFTHSHLAERVKHVPQHSFRLIFISASLENRDLISNSVGNDNINVFRLEVPQVTSVNH